MFENLTQRLQATFAKLRGRGRLTEQDVDAALREVRLALLEADVNFRVVKDFIAGVRERAVGQEVLSSLSPAHQVIKIVNEQLTHLMGGSQAKLALSSKIPATILIVGLQGSGKTTSAAKLALRLKKEGHRPLLAAADIYRPAAIKQLQVLAAQADVPVFSMGESNPVDISKAAIEHARRNGNDILLIDTAGRLQVDTQLMAELEQIKAATNPSDILLVVDAMAGQDAINVATTFNEQLSIGGIILTKLDGDARGGAALSVKAVTGKPIKFVTTGEKLDALEGFHPDRMASRILGMGDVLTLIEQAEANIDEGQAKQMAQRMLRDEFNLDDFLTQLQQVRKMGPLDQILGMIPGLSGKKELNDDLVDEKQIKRVEAIIQAMTQNERANPSILNGSRRLRIAKGSGTSVQEVNRLLRQFENMKLMMKRFGGLQRGRRRSLSNLFP
ncbi:MAG: signal recognition particle protein [Candidatus Cloacimonetes bacterium]|nr:signal recognition particle protein [Candidatus Cloacimonadota bacterium]